MKSRAAELFPHSQQLQERWLAAVEYLRAGRGWIADQVSAEALRAQAKQMSAAPEEPRFRDRVVPITKWRNKP